MGGTKNGHFLDPKISPNFRDRQKCFEDAWTLKHFEPFLKNLKNWPNFGDSKIDDF